MKRKRIFSLIADCLFVFIFIYLLIFPQYASEPTRFALVFCANTLIPSLFIYTVLSRIVISLPITQRAAKLVGISPITLIIGTLCGCPIGAKTAVALYENGRIDKRHAEYLCSFTNNASVSFVLGFVGKELFGDVFVGVRLLVYQLFGSLAAAAVMKYLIFGREKIPKANFSRLQRTTLRESLTDGAMTMLNLASCAVFFIVASDAVSHIVPFSEYSFAIFKSVLEFSSGCAEASKLGDSALPITAFALGHCGASVMLQVRSVTAGRLSLKPYVSGKLISCAVMTALAVIFG